MSRERSDFLLSLCLLLITIIFFSGKWCPTHPSIALPCPVGSCYGLWRSQSLGPDEQGLIHLTGRYLFTSNHCGDGGRRCEGLCEASPVNSADVSPLDLWLSQLRPLPGFTVWLLLEQMFCFLQPVYRYPKVIGSSCDSINLFKACAFYQLNIIRQRGQAGDKCPVVAITRNI